MSLNRNYCRLCLQETKGPAAETLFRDSKIFMLVANLFPDMDTSIVINSMFCKECIEYAQLANLMIETVTKNEQKIVLDLQNTELFELITCRLCLNNEKLDVALYLFKNTNEAARHVIEIAIINLDFDLIRKPVVCNSCWQMVKSIYLFKKKCFATERILKCYCDTNGINSLDRKELEIISLSYQEKMFSENLDEDNFLFDVNTISIPNSNLTQNIVDPQNMYLNNLTEDKDNVFEEVSYIANILNVKSESIKDEDEIEIKEEKLCEFIESNENVGMNLENIGRIQQTEITSNASEILTNKTKNMENICHSIQKKYQQSDVRNHGSEHQIHLSLKSEECPYETIEEVNIELHLKAHQSEKNVLKCSECYYITMCSNSLKNHMETCASKPKSFKCQKCDYVTRKHSNLMSHKLSHQENYNFKCQKCSFQTKRKGDLIQHMLIHEDNFNFQCHKCSYQTKRKACLVSHMLIHEENHIYFKCQKCSYKAKRKTNLVNHMLIHEENYKFQCHKCSYQAKRKGNLVRHMMSHQDICNFQCHRCSYQTKRKDDLVSHMLIHEENYSYFKCHKCSFQTKRKSNLVRHMSSHQDNCNFKCHRCSYQTKRKDSLKQHILIHQDNCSFQCQKCSYKTKIKSNLTRHMLIHQDKCHFQCHSCSYQTKRKADLIPHVLIHQIIEGHNA